MLARTTALVLAALALAVSGCSYNPGYFPWIVQPGRIEQTHAKPRGFGYFRNFDPKACRLGVNPSGQANAPLGSQISDQLRGYDTRWPSRIFSSVLMPAS